MMALVGKHVQNQSRLEAVACKITVKKIVYYSKTKKNNYWIEQIVYRNSMGNIEAVTPQFLFTPRLQLVIVAIVTHL